MGGGKKGGVLGGCVQSRSLVEVFKWLVAVSVLSALSKHPSLKRKNREKNLQLASHTAGQGLTSSPLVCSPLRRAFTRDGRNTKRAGIDFLLGGVEEEREGCWRVVGLTAHIKLPSFSLTPLPFSSSPSHLPGSGGTLCLSARQWSVSL